MLKKQVFKPFEAFTLAFFATYDVVIYKTVFIKLLYYEYFIRDILFSDSRSLHL